MKKLSQFLNLKRPRQEASASPSTDATAKPQRAKEATNEFAALGLVKPILRALELEGYSVPTPIQAQAIPPILAGTDVLGCAQTGTGKTAAFALPILQNLLLRSERRQPGIRTLILTPTRELAIQIDESFATYGQFTDVTQAVIFGGVDQKKQVTALRQMPQVLTATPGRLLDLIGQKLLQLGHIETFVLDEADRMLDMGFIHDVRKVIALLPTRRQTLFFSATMPPDIQKLAGNILKKPVRIEVTPVSSTAEAIEQVLFHVDKPNKRHLLLHLLKDAQIKKALAFTRTKHTANRVAEFLTKSGVVAAAIHSNKSQSARQRALASFKEGKTRILVASDIAARGIDIEEITHVFNYDLPNVAETYVHRIGRTGRAAASGIAWSFCEAEELSYVVNIERLTRQKLPVEINHPYHADFRNRSPSSSTRPANDQRPASRPRRGKPRGGRPPRTDRGRS